MLEEPAPLRERREFPELAAAHGLVESPGCRDRPPPAPRREDPPLPSRLRSARARRRVALSRAGARLRVRLPRPPPARGRDGRGDGAARASHGRARGRTPERDARDAAELIITVVALRAGTQGKALVIVDRRLDSREPPPDPRPVAALVGGLNERATRRFDPRAVGHGIDDDAPFRHRPAMIPTLFELVQQVAASRCRHPERHEYAWITSRRRHLSELRRERELHGPGLSRSSIRCLRTPPDTSRSSLRRR